MSRNKSKKQSMRKFLIAFSITITAFVVLGGSGYAIFRAIAQPPDLERYVTFDILLDNRENESAFIITDVVGSELLGGEVVITDDSLRQEERTITFERRPYFYTFLIYGLDDGINADTIIVAAFDAEARQAYLISIPRDTRVDVERRQGLRKLVAAFPIGTQQGRGHAGGVEQLKTEISTLIGFRPDFYIGVNHRGFTRLIDTLGGVEVTIPFRMVYNDPYQDLHINLHPGQQRLNGEQALHFARFRQFNRDCPYARNFTDFQRMESQQQIISSAVNELLSPRTITQIPQLVSIFNENVRTNISASEMLYFIQYAPSLAGGNILTTYSYPIARTERVGWYEIPDKEAALELINRTINPFTQDIMPEMLRIVE